MSTKTDEMTEFSRKGQYQQIADLLSSNDFVNFESAASVLVRSDGLTAEDKIALGTIKRYGVVADALIMLGGLAGELKAGGYSIKSTPSAQQAITDDGDEDSDEVKVVNPNEVNKYIRLSHDSLGDVLKIIKPLL
eukprot:gene14479-19436_t